MREGEKEREAHTVVMSEDTRVLGMEIIDPEMPKASGVT